MKLIPKGRNNQKLVVLKNRLEQRRITQIDLEEFLLLTHQLEDAETIWSLKREYISAALKRGAEVEPGVHRAKFKEDLIVE